MNQNLRKKIENSGQILPLMETFKTIQGEGFHTGKVAHFIRIGGCDIGCHWCDIKESWDSELYPWVKIVDIAESIDNSTEIVVISGGEPLMWNMIPLTYQLRKKNKRIHLETSGAYELSGNWDWICLSPKKNKQPILNLLKRANELKVVVYNKHDLKFAEQKRNQLEKVWD